MAKRALPTVAYPRPHRPNFGHLNFHITSACYEHAPFIGLKVERLDSFSKDLLHVLANNGAAVAGWCVLPNHYHVLIETENVLKILHSIGRLHGRTSRAWNLDE